MKWKERCEAAERALVQEIEDNRLAQGEMQRAVEASRKNARAKGMREAAQMVINLCPRGAGLVCDDCVSTSVAIKKAAEGLFKKEDDLKGANGTNKGSIR